MLADLTKPKILTELQWQKYLSKVSDTQHGWMWTGAPSHGYGRFWVGQIGRYVPAHVLMFEAANGFPPVNIIDHTCNIPLCVTPICLEDVTQAENIRRMWERGRDNTNIIQPTHCVNGHKFDKLIKKSNGGLQQGCSICRRDAVRRYRATH